jgi:hypothetical protein
MWLRGTAHIGIGDQTGMPACEAVAAGAGCAASLTTSCRSSQILCDFVGGGVGGVRGAGTVWPNVAADVWLAPGFATWA